jgi:hypothetical protein
MQIVANKAGADIWQARKQNWLSRHSTCLNMSFPIVIKNCKFRYLKPSEKGRQFNYLK